ncbi:MAG: hypothetical protein HN904_25425 [Victivallales bacterium]|jgi:hypothetical protein|nr:hypothetical protein [Victivallales bacterium]
MHEDYLRKGIVALSRVLDSGYPGSDRGWFAGHWPCAVIAAYYFCRDNPVDPGVDAAVTREVERVIDRHRELFAPHEAETGVETRRVEGLVRSLQASITRFMVSGHNVIYAAYAVRVLADKPELGTPPVLNGLQALIGYFAGRTDGVVPSQSLVDGKSLTPEYGSDDDMIAGVFATLQYAPRLSDRHRILFDGHTMTHAHALALLSRLGFGAIARQGHASHRVHMEQNRETQSQHINERWTEKVTVDDHPFTCAFWDRDFDRFDRQWEWGHVFKYLYSFYDLVDRVDDPRINRCCEMQLAYLV